MERSETKGGLIQHLIERKQMKKILVVLAVLFLLSLFAEDSKAQTFTTLYSFQGFPTDGASPYDGSLAISADGSTLYGMTWRGGAYGGLFSSYGSIFSMPTRGGTSTTPFSFVGTYGENPYGSVTLSPDGSTLYGMTYMGGTNFVGTIFSFPASGGTPTTLFNFDGTHGQYPNGGLTLSGSTLYGMTPNGGVYNDGAIFCLPVTGGTPTLLASFDVTHGQYPNGDLTLRGSTLYGTTYLGGANNEGTVFSLPVSGGTPTVLFSFNGTHGEYLHGDLTLSGSLLYGMAQQGGANNDGTIFSLPVSGGTPTTLYSFDTTHGAEPYGGLTLVGSTLYGMTEFGGAFNDGTLFEINTDGSGFEDLLSFSGSNGANPCGNLTLSPNGSTLYGTTHAGGAYGYVTNSAGDGTVFAFNLTPEPSTLALLAVGGISLAAYAWRRRKRSVAVETDSQDDGPAILSMPSRWKEAARRAA